MQVRQTAEEVRMISYVTFLYGLHHMDTLLLADHLYADTGCCLEQCQMKEPIGTDGERNQNKFVLSIRLGAADDDNDIVTLLFA